MKFRHGILLVADIAACLLLLAHTPPSEPPPEPVELSVAMAWGDSG